MTLTLFRLCYKNIKIIFCRPLFLLFLIFTLCFDIFVSLYVKNIAHFIYQKLQPYLTFSKSVFFNYVFLSFIFSVFIFSFTMLAIDIPLDNFSRELQDKSTEILVKYFSRASYFFSKVISFILTIYIFLFIHLIIVYLIFSDIITFSIFDIIIISFKLLYSLLIILSLSITLDLIIKKPTLIPTLLGSLNLIAGFIIIGSAITNFSAYIASYFAFAPQNVKMPEYLENLYGILAKIGKYNKMFEYFKNLEIFVLPFSEYFKVSFASIYSYVVNMTDFPFYFGINISLFDMCFPMLWFLIIIFLAYIYFNYKDI